MPLLADIRNFLSGRRDGHRTTRALPEGESDQVMRSMREAGELLRRLVSSLEARDANAAAAIERLDGIPKAVENLGDLRRHAATIVDAVGEHAESARRHGESVETALTRMHDALGGQADAMAGATDRIEAIVRTVGGLSEELERLRGALAEIATTGSRSSDALRGLAESGRRREEVFLERVATWQRWTTILLGLAALGSLSAAVATIVIALR